MSIDDPSGLLSMYVDGRWSAAEDGETFESTSPATGERLALVPRGTRGDAQRAIEAAGRAAVGWARASAFERAAALERVVVALEERREELARTLTLDQGKPLAAESRGEVEELIVYFKMAAADATRLDGLIPPSVDPDKRVLVTRVPRGVVGVISPWNWPYTMPAELIAPALAAGNAVVWNPASNTSLCAVRLAECIVAGGFPPGVFNLVTGPGSVVGDEIAGNPGTHAIGFVGSVEAGRKVAERAAGKEILLELGGNGPLVVLEDADIEAAAAATLTACFLNAGQSCTAGERILVHERVHEAYVAALTAAIARDVRLGDPLDDATTMGPLNNAPTVAKTARHVTDAVERGATLVAGGHRVRPGGGAADGSLYFEPTVLDGVTEEMEVAREETFGPVAPITVIRSVEEAIEIVNASAFGLLSAVFTRDLATGLRFAEAVRSGWVNVNEGTNYWESHLPFGGRAGSDSGVGRVGGRFALERFTELKTIVIDLG
jgi:acyl-CoA reductase-like NAD-dependent aldehyde dehydrogenase